ncbi:MAG: chitobiase/beta-hexosaminidase C-terminal domain-containing protein [Lachnospiraceae bacterium]|nr:chitobiase/beta-hexosaminidase C-terminal domain-containing protein [Lachnospiraceae bacterium]
MGNTSVTLFVKGISKLHTVSGLNGSSDYSYSIADLLSPSEIYVGTERGVVRRLGSVSVNKDGGGHIIGFTGLSDAEKAVFPDSGKLYEAYEVEGLPADKVKLDSRLKVYDDFGNLIGASSEGLSIVSLNTGKYAEAEVTGFGILDASDVLSPENFAVAVYNGSGEHVRGMVQTTRQTLLPAGTYTVLLCPSCYSAPYSLTGWKMDEESGVQKLENVVITSGSVKSVYAQLRPSESSSYAILNAPEKAAAGEVYEVRGMIHPGANGLKCLRVSAPGMCQFILDGKTMKGKVYTGSFYCMDYEELNLTEDVPVRISIRMPEADVRDGSHNTVYIESWETKNYRTRTWNLGRVSTEKAGGLSLHIPARADMDIETGRAEIRYTGHSSAGGGRPVYLYDNDVPAGSAFTDNYGDFSGVLALATGGLFHTIRASYVFSEAGADRSYDPNDVECQLLCQAGQAILTGITMHCRTGGISEDVDMAPGQAQKKYTVRGEMHASYSATVKNVSAYRSPRTDGADPLPAGSKGKVSETAFSGLKKFRTFVKGDKVRWKEADENYDTEKHEVTIGTEGVAFFKVRTTDGSFTVPAETFEVNKDGTVTFFSEEVSQGNSFTNGVSLLFEAGSDGGYVGSGYYSPAAILRNEDGTPVDESGNPVVNENGELLPGKEFSVIENGTTNYDLLTIRNLAPLTVSRADADAYKAVKYNTGSENYISEGDVSYGQDSEGKRIPVEIGGSSAENLKRLNMAGLSDNSLVENLSFDTTPKEEPESTGSGPDSIEAAGAADSLMDAVSYEKFMGYKNTNSWSVKEAPAQKPTTLKGIIEERNRQLLENLIAMKDTIENDSELKQNVDRFGMVDEDNARKVNEKDYSLVTLVDYASAVDEGMMDKMGYRETVYEYKTKDEDGNPTSDTLVMKVYTATTFYKKNGEIIADPSLQSYETAAATLDTYIFYNPEVAEAAENPTITADLHPFKWTRIQLASMIPGANCPIYTGGFVAPLATWTPTSYTPISPTGSAGITATGDTSVNGNDVEAAGGTKFKPVENTKIGFFGTGFRFDLNPKNWSDGTKIAGAGLALGYFNKFRNAALKRAQDAAKNGKEIKNLEFMDGKGSYSMADDTIRIGKYEKVPGTEKWTIKDLKWYGNETYQYYTKVEWETAYKSIMNVKVSDIVNGGSAGFSALSMYKSYQPSNPPTYKEMMNDTRQQLRDALRWVSKNEELKKNMDEDAYQALMQSIVDRMNVLTEVEKDAECADHQNEFTGGAGVKVIDGINFVSGLIPDPTGICETINLTSGTISFVLNAANDNAQAHRLERIQDYGVKHDMFMTMLMSYGYPPKKDDKKGGGSGSDPEQPDEVDPGTPESGGGNPPSDTSCVQVQDPSGTVYEAVLSNPVEGATVRLYTADAKAEGGDSWKPEYEKDASGTWVYYDEDSGRPKEPKNVPSINGIVERKIPGPQLILPENPVQLTGEDGRFQWDVTEGLWYVEAEKPGYNLDNEGTAQPSDSGGDTASTVSRNGISWMPVLPAQLEVNLPMVDKTAPFVIDDEEDTENIDNIRMQSDGVYITFSKYMEEESLGISEDAAVSAAETSGLRTVSCGMVPTHYVIYDSDGEEIPYTLFLLNSEQAPGNRAGDYAGEAPWYTSKLLLQFTEDREEETGEELSVRLICGGGHFVSYAGTPMAQDYVATRTTVPKHRTEEPVFDPPSGTVFTKDGDNHVTITCATEGAVIYYTTDGSEPLSGLLPGATAKQYGEPVLITGDVTIRAAARRQGYFDSLTAEASYTVKQDGGGGGGDDDEEPVSDDFWLTGFRKKLSYTGKKLTQPDISLHFGDVTLISGKDYRVTYLNNLNAGTAKMILKGVGNYDMTLEYPFEILPVSIAGAEFDSPDISVKKPKSGNARRPKIVLKWGSRTLRQGSERDYTVDDSSVDYGKAGTYTIRLKGVKNFTGEYPVEYILTGDVLMSAVKISGLKAQDWTGEPVILRPSSSAVPGKGEFTVKYGGKVITKGFTVSFNHNTDAGTAKLILKGTGEDCGDGKGTKLAGTKAVTFKIKGRPIRKAVVDALPTDAVYDGNPHTPAAKLTWGGTALKEGTDYTVSYSKNINAGKASVSYKGMGGYTGTLKKTFKIAKCDLADTSGLITVSVGAAPYEKGGAKPEVRLFLSGNELIAGQDFALKYNDNKAAGRTGTVTILGKKNFKGSISRSFEVTVRSLSCLNLVVPDVVWRNKKGNYRTKPVLYDLNGKRLAVNTDYEGTFTYRKSSASGNEGALLEEADQMEKGTWLMVSLTAKGGNYTGTVSGVFRVVEKSISSVRFVIPDQTYIPGGSAELSQSEIDRITSTPAGVKTEVVPGSYKNNTRAGKASVTLHGLGSYGGTKTVTFRVRRRTKKVTADKK